MVGIDANAAVLYDGFLRAQKARLSNALFVVASAESLPEQLTACADEVRIQFPWGSLLEAVLGGDQVVLAGVARLLRRDGRLRVLLSVVERDRVHGMAALDGPRAAEVAGRIAGIKVGFVAELVREATWADIAASHSTWAKRLAAGRSRPAWLLEFRRAGRPEESPNTCNLDCAGESEDA